MRVYISGPMTGYPDYNLAAFNRAESDLRALGHETLNPARHGADPNKSWSDYLRQDVVDVVAADAVCLLPGWEASRGARLEVHIAHALGMTTMPLDNWRAQ